MLSLARVSIKPRISSKSSIGTSRRFYCQGEEPQLAGTKTLQNLRDAFAGEAMANRRFLFFAQKADIEGNTEVARLFRDAAEGETAHANGHLFFLEEVGDPVTNLPLGSSEDNLKAAIDGATHESTEMYPQYAQVAREEGLDQIADWFETLAQAEQRHAANFNKALKELELSKE